ncbi:MAG: hypothetical protein WC243_03820 [Patescibacteria group bacterium]|jgi:hypothetical protein
MKGTKFYVAWKGMKFRCSAGKKYSDFNSYGGKGVKVCRRWKRFINFRDDMYESYLKHIIDFGEKQTSLDRINNNGNYCKANCRWATLKEQNSNRKYGLNYTFKGETHCLSEWSNKLGFTYKILRNRIRDLNWSIEKTFTTPINKKLSNRFRGFL